MSGLPRIPPEILFVAMMSDNPYRNYTPELMCRFLSGYELPRDIGEQWEYSNLGAGLLGHALARQAGVTYEELVAARVCQPLGMNDTCIKLSAEQKTRRARGHTAESKPAADWDFDALTGAGALRSTAADLLTFADAQLRPPATPLGAAIRDTHRVRIGKTTIPDHGQCLGWLKLTLGEHTSFWWHNGGTAGYESFVGFWPDAETAVVVLSNSSAAGHGATQVGLALLTVLDDRPATAPEAPSAASQTSDGVHDRSR
jgi:CubicO group peptidase (beta-lactamase class C family)